ncbi:MAG TPA: hypothetical protein VFA55_05560, partial [Candidatus Kapabacteria bacterium]|nr:hypothetical protein [Candidatus Kapabacteria bacterium]
FDDTSVVNYKKYIYRLCGITPFGDLSQSAYVESYGRDLTPPPAPLPKMPKQIGTNSLKLTWTMPDSLPEDLAGFAIARSANSVAGYHQLFDKLLPKDAREYIDDSASANEPYYIIASVDTAGNVAPSLPVFGEMVDSTPPSIPTGLTGTIDTNGIVHLHWHLGPEQNIIGYRVLWANSPTHEFSQRTGKPIRDTAFTDTISLLTTTPYIYYRIAAVNNRYNHSALSEIVAIRRPDKLPPASPVFTDVFVTDSAVQLTWAPSPSEDVAAHILYRRLPDQKDWAKIASLGPKDKEYTDTAVKQNVIYQYTLKAMDSSGLYSLGALPVQARPFDNGSRPPVEDVEAVFDSAGHKVTVTWSYRSIKNEKYFYILYRSVKNSPLTEYKAVDESQTQFTDTDLIGAGLYEYAVKVKTRNGAESRVSTHARVAVR